MMLQKTYSAYSDDVTNQHLFIEMGYNHLACWCKKEGENKFAAFEFFQCGDYDASIIDSLINEAKLHSKLLTLDVIDTAIIWSTVKNLAIPAQFANENFLQDNFNLIRGAYNKGKLYQTQFEDVSIVTSIDVYLQNATQHIFPHAVFYGGFKLSKPVYATAVNLFFYPHCFFCFVYKDSKLLFAQSKLYNEAADVLYFVLNLLHQYKLEKNINVLAGGFINQQSKLYETLYQYLEGFTLGEVDNAVFASDEFKEHPSHYFLPYVNYLV